MAELPLPRAQCGRLSLADRWLITSFMNHPAQILCIGSILWDVIGRAPSHMVAGADVPGRIARVPGGVAMNIAMTLRRFGLRPRMLSAIGRDAEGREFIAEAERMETDVGLVYCSDSLPTDRYMAIEDAGGLVAAIADAHSLEAAGDRILAPLVDGRIASDGALYDGLAALDGNLSEGLLMDIARGPWLARADLRIAPASPGKALRLLPFLDHPRATLYLNLEEAGLLLGDCPAGAAEAAGALVRRGVNRVTVTDGGRSAALAEAGEVITAVPPSVRVSRVTGAGDAFMAAHIAAETQGARGRESLSRALSAAAAHVSGENGS